MYSIKFIKQFLHAPRYVGAVLPSSHILAERVVKEAGVAEASAVVEWGPGTGAITGAILEKLPPTAAFFAMEINPEFVETMRMQFPGVTVHNDSAENTRRYLEQRGLQHCDSVVSGLPWTSFPDPLQDSLLSALVDVLRPGGRFVTYSYIMSPLVPGGRRFRQKLRDHFSRVDMTPFVWRNVPPAFVYVAYK